MHLKRVYIIFFYLTFILSPSSSDKISRNFAHLLRQRSFYPIYPPPDQVCIDYEAWLKHARIETHPNVFIAFSDLATFNKDVNNCTCLNPGRLIRGTSIGSYAQITLKPSKNKQDEKTSETQARSPVHPNISVTFHKLNQQ
jgi:DNA polymerase alpha subunit B